MNDDDITIWDCPEARCKGKLIKRRNKTTGEEFLGCTEYPKCTYTQPMEYNNDEFAGAPDRASVWDREDEYPYKQ